MTPPALPLTIVSGTPAPRQAPDAPPSTLDNPELAPYAGALRPAYARDLESFGDATRYDLDIAIDPVARRVSGRQMTRYTNRGAAELTEILLRLYPNTAYISSAMRITSLVVEGVPVEPAPWLGVAPATEAVAPRTGLRAVITETPGMAAVAPRTGLRAGFPETPTTETQAAGVMTETALADTSVVSFPLAVPLRPGQSVVFTLTYEIDVPMTSTTGYRTFGIYNGIVALPNAFAMLPVRDEYGWRVDPSPEWGDIVYGESSLFRARIRVPPDYTVVATGVCQDAARSAPAASEPQTAVPDAGVDPQPDGWRTVDCTAAPVRDFAIQISDRFRELRTALASDGDTISVSSFHVPESRAGGERALVYAAASLREFERRFGAYPFKELKVFMSPTTAGGIEYPMLAGVTDALYNQEGGYFEWVTVHEVAHQWWYSMVGSDPVNEAWLDEALAQYSASLYVEDRYGEAAARAERDRYFTRRYRDEVARYQDARVAQPTSAFDRSSYGPIVYGKGPLFFDAVRQQVGDSRFIAWLRAYLNRFRYRIARAEDLLSLADEIGIGQPVRAAYQEWILGVRGNAR